MGKTPRTDEKEFAAIDLKPSARVVYASFTRQLETELADAKAEIERLNKSLGDSLGTIFAMLLAARGAECDIDTLQAEMKPVSSKPNEYIKHIIAERDKLIEH